MDVVWQPMFVKGAYSMCWFYECTLIFCWCFLIMMVIRCCVVTGACKGIYCMNSFIHVLCALCASKSSVEFQNKIFF